MVVSAGPSGPSRKDPDTGRARIREITRWRRDHQPGGTLNAGSVFKNPPGDSAGRIIDELGLKGFRVRGAAVSERHANFFEADRDAAAQDVFDLVDRRSAPECGRRRAITLEPEMRFVGDFERASRRRGRDHHHGSPDRASPRLGARRRGAPAAAPLAGLAIVVAAVAGTAAWVVYQSPYLQGTVRSPSPGASRSAAAEVVSATGVAPGMPTINVQGGKSRSGARSPIPGWPPPVFGSPGREPSTWRWWSTSPRAWVAVPATAGC